MRFVLRPRWSMAALLLAVAARTFLCPALAQGEAQSAERLVKAAYLYHFCQLVTWPAASFSGPDAPLRVAVLGDDELADELARAVAARARQGRPIQVEKLRRNGAQSQPHLLYVAGSMQATLTEILASYRDQPVLTVTDAERALEHGSVINFLVVDGSLRFEVSLRAAAQAGLHISTRLLAVSWKFAAVSPKMR